jgi:sugar phosphate isomerase/epimerase
MRIGFASLIGVEPMPFADLISEASRRNLTALEVNVGPNFPHINGASFGGHLDLESVVQHGPGPVEEMLGHSGATIHSLAPMLNLLSANPELRAERIRYMRLTIDACVVLGVKTVVTFTGSAYGMSFYGVPGVGDYHPSNRVADNLSHFREVYGPLADYAEERGIRIAFETAGRGGAEGNLAHSPELWDRMFETVPSPALGLSFDPSHLVWLHIPNVPDVIRAYGDRIYHVDGKDIEILRARLARQGILGSGWWRYRLPGLGELDWSAIFSALADVGYDGIVAIENEDPLCHGLNGVEWSANYLNRHVLPTQASTPVFDANRELTRMKDKS